MSKKNSIRHPFYGEVWVPVAEEWKDLPEFEGYYLMSTQGRVKSLSRIVPHPLRCGTYTVREKILIPKHAGDSPYLYIMLCKGEKEYTKLAHRLVLETFIGPCPEGMWCRHLDNNSENNRLENLCWDTVQNNQQDKCKFGTSTEGVLGNTYKLKGRVKELYDLWKAGQHSIKELAGIFEMTVPGICYHVRKFKSSGPPKLKER